MIAGSMAQKFTLLKDCADLTHQWRGTVNKKYEYLPPTAFYRAVLYMWLCEEDGGEFSFTSVAELGQRVGISRKAMQSIVDRMHREGLITGSEIREQGQPVRTTFKLSDFGRTIATL